jgi:hypothetical protein
MLIKGSEEVKEMGEVGEITVEERKREPAVRRRSEKEGESEKENEQEEREREVPEEERIYGTV